MKASRKAPKHRDQGQQEADGVVLRRWRQGGGLIALFPESLASMDGLVMSYQHIGQHGAADYQQVICNSAPVPLGDPDQDRDELLDELRAIGYHPEVRQRRGRGKRWPDEEVRK